MNQAIEFPDRAGWDESINAVCFPAIVDGFQLTCAISGEAIVRRYGNEQAVLTSFLLHRWDLEEEAEAAIKEATADDQGRVWLS